MRFGNILNRILASINNELGLSGDNAIVLQNISFLESNDGDSNSFMSIVNIEEEKSLRNAQFTTSYTLPNETIPQVFEHNAVNFINLFVIFSFHRSDNYGIALDNLGQLISFIQRKAIYSKEELNLSTTQTVPEFEKIVFELYSLSFEQMNHLWGVLGGKYIPSVLYKLRVFPIRELPEAPSNIIRRPRANVTEKT